MNPFLKKKKGMSQHQLKTEILFILNIVMEYDHNSNLCKAVDHSPSGRRVKKQHGHPHHIVEQP